jgi:sugar/nucleoside kinase (ribokinase family)
MLRKREMMMPRVGCAGILVKDTFCGPLNSLPKAGELVAVDGLRTSAGGCAANVAIDLCKQGVDVYVAGCVGRDAAGDALVKSLQFAGVNCDWIVRVGKHSTSETIVLLVAGEDRRYLHSFGANREFAISQIERDWLAELTVFYLGGLFAMPNIDPSELLELLKFCRKKGVVSVVDVVLPVGFSDAQKLRCLLPFIDWFLPNDTEAAMLTEQSDPLNALEIFRDWQAKGVVITMGDRGAIGLLGDQCWRCDAYCWGTVDPSGAGDAFASGVIAGIIKGWDLSRTLAYASALGASATRAIGTTIGVFGREEAEQIVTRYPISVVREKLPVTKK